MPDRGHGTRHTIRARSHLLQLLGEELIGDDRLAIFELVKNGYDADATTVDVVVDLKSKKQSIIVQDNGSGMTLDDITGKWLELATDSRRRGDGRRSPRFRRRPLGEKGVGRIAVFKLGSTVTLNTRAHGKSEYQATIDWETLLNQGEYLEDLRVLITPLAVPAFFPGGATGTRITISGLRRPVWSRGDLRRLYRLVTSLASPFHTPDQFAVSFSAPGREADVADLIAPNEFLEHSVWRFDFSITGGSFQWDYSFRPPHWKGVTPRVLKKTDDRLALAPAIDEDGRKTRPGKENDQLLLRKADQDGIGPVKGNIFVYYRRAEVLNASGSSSQLKSWLDDQTGVRVYRDGVRVFTYGEGADDWLGLNARRINTPAGKLGTNSVVAAIHLDLAKSTGLREKTNREGFDQNDAFQRLRRIVLSVFEHLELQHSEDRKSLDDALRGTTSAAPRRKFTEAITHLRSGLRSKQLDAKFEPDIDSIEQDFLELRDVMTNAGMAGLNLAVIFHEVEREVEALAHSVDRGLDAARIRAQVEHLHELLQGFAPLLRKNPIRSAFASDLVRAASRTREARFRFHKIDFSAPLLAKDQADFKVKGASNLLIGAIGNLLDNAIYWSRYRRERDERTAKPAILVTTDWNSESRTGMIAVVDNGPGFTIPDRRAVEAFVTTRPGGMGLGLYFANLVMQQIGGELTVHEASELRDEVPIPKSFDGAAVALRFGELR